MNENDKIALEKIRALWDKHTKEKLSPLKVLWDQYYFLKDWRDEVYYMDISNCSSDFKYGVSKLIYAADQIINNAKAVSWFNGLKSVVNKFDFRPQAYYFNVSARQKEWNNLTKMLEQLDEIANRT